MKRVIGSLFLLIFLYLLQTTFINEIAIAGIKPNVLIVVVVLNGYRYGKIPGILMGFFTGLFLDLAEGSLLGYHALIYMMVGYLVGFVHKFYSRDFIIIPTFLVAFSDLALNFMFFISGFLVRNRLDFPYYFIRIILPECLYTMVISVLLYKLADFLFVFIDKKKPESKEKGKGGTEID